MSSQLHWLINQRGCDYLNWNALQLVGPFLFGWRYQGYDSITPTFKVSVCFPPTLQKKDWRVCQSWWDGVTGTLEAIWANKGMRRAGFSKPALAFGWFASSPLSCRQTPKPTSSSAEAAVERKHLSPCWTCGIWNSGPRERIGCSSNCAACGIPHNAMLWIGSQDSAGYHCQECSQQILSPACHCGKCIRVLLAGRSSPMGVASKARQV